MPRKLSHHLAFGGVPDLEEARICTDSQMVPSVRPLHACDSVILSEVIEFGDFAGSGRPEVYT
jgi:hypothetical protein